MPTIMNFESPSLIFLSLLLFQELYLHLKFSKFCLSSNISDFDTPWLFLIRRGMRTFWTLDDLLLGNIGQMLADFGR